jgi:hypothetical protein
MWRKVYDPINKGFSEIPKPLTYNSHSTELASLLWYSKESVSCLSSGDVREQHVGTMQTALQVQGHTARSIYTTQTKQYGPQPYAWYPSIFIKLLKGTRIIFFCCVSETNIKSTTPYSPTNQHIDFDSSQCGITTIQSAEAYIWEVYWSWKKLNLHVLRKKKVVSGIPPLCLNICAPHQSLEGSKDFVHISDSRVSPSWVGALLYINIIAPNTWAIQMGPQNKNLTSLKTILTILIKFQ